MRCSDGVRWEVPDPKPTLLHDLRKTIITCLPPTGFECEVNNITFLQRVFVIKMHV